MVVLIPRSNKLKSIRRLLGKKHKVSKFHIPIWSILILSITIITIITIIIVKLIIGTDPGPKRSLFNYDTQKDFTFSQGCTNLESINEPRANATLVMLARNSEIKDVVKSMKSLERHFNQWFQYPWLFLNDDEFDQNFKDSVIQITNAEVNFGKINKTIWDFPDELTRTWEFKESIENQGDRGIMYGSMESYHKMCRFFSGFFYKHPLVQKYEWYWRVEPDVEFFCDITYDPFVEMANNNKKYGFTIMIRELVETVPNLFRITKQFLKQNDIKTKSSWDLFSYDYTKDLKINSQSRFDTFFKNIKDLDSLRSKIEQVLKVETFWKNIESSKNRPIKSDKNLDKDKLNQVIDFAKSKPSLLAKEQIDNEEYNLLHFWSNFEIAKVSLWDNEIYNKYFEFLESKGGFYRERWGDAPVHSIALGFLLDLEEIHYFRDIGYKHTTIAHCPSNHPNQKPYKESSNYKLANDVKFNKFWSHFDSPKEYGVGCRCRCPSGHEDIEDAGDDYLEQWFELNRDDPEEFDLINVNKIERLTKQKLKLDGII